MWRPESLVDYYSYTATIHWSTAIPSRLALAVILYLVATGNEKPGFRLLSAVLASHFLVSGFLALGHGGAVAALCMISLVLAGAAGWAAAQDRIRWVVLPEDDPWRTMALGVYLAAFIAPVWEGVPVLRQILYAPMGPLPHQGLVVLLTAVAATGPGRVGVLGPVAGGAAVVLGLVDLAVGNRLVGAVVLAGGIAVLALPRMAGWTASGGDGETAGGAFPGPERRKPKDPAAGEGSKRRKWDLS